MAKVIRNQWVWKKQGHNYRYLPRRNDGQKEFDFEASAAGPEHFPEKLNEAPPKLWIAWIYREPAGARSKHWLKKLFGEDYRVGKMEVFKNTASQNKVLWHVKHLIDLKPLRFPNGEPTLDDVNSLEVLYDGNCVVDKRISCNESQLSVRDPSKQWSPAELSGHLGSRYRQCLDVFEDTVYNPSNITIVN